jgi:hypothetical protein
MNDVLDDPTGRWGLIFHVSGQHTPTHTRDDWRRIAEAIRAADVAHRAGATIHIGRPAVRGDAAWCRIAADTWADLTVAADPSTWHTDGLEGFVDEPAVRAWLDAPWVPPGDRPQTMAEVAGWDELFDPRYRPDAAALAGLVEQAQHVGVFGIPDHRIALWQWSIRGREPTFVVTVAPPDGPGWASPPVARDRLVHVGRPPTDAIVDVLHQVADVAGRLLSNGARRPAAPGLQRDDVRLVAGNVGGWPVGSPARAFPPLRQVPPVPAAHPAQPIEPRGTHRAAPVPRLPRGARHG